VKHTGSKCPCGDPNCLGGMAPKSVTVRYRLQAMPGVPSATDVEAVSVYRLPETPAGLLQLVQELALAGFLKPRRHSWLTTDASRTCVCGLVQRRPFPHRAHGVCPASALGLLSGVTPEAIDWAKVEVQPKQPKRKAPK
jgi:hypothetical protein